MNGSKEELLIIKPDFNVKSKWRLEKRVTGEKAKEFGEGSDEGNEVVYGCILRWVSWLSGIAIDKIMKERYKINIRCMKRRTCVQVAKHRKLRCLDVLPSRTLRELLHWLRTKCGHEAPSAPKNLVVFLPINFIFTVDSLIPLHSEVLAVTGWSARLSLLLKIDSPFKHCCYARLSKKNGCAR